MKPFLKIGAALVYTPAHFTLYGWHVRQVLGFSHHHAESARIRQTTVSQFSCGWAGTSTEDDQ